MKNILLIDSFGEVVYLASTNSEKASFSLPNTTAKEVSQEVYDQAKKAKGSYYQGDTLVKRPARPSPYHFWDKQNKVWVLDEVVRSTEESAETRAMRDRLLAESDWTDTLSFRERNGEAKYAEWQTYRQALRDITKQQKFPLNVSWPVSPT